MAESVTIECNANMDITTVENFHHQLEEVLNDGCSVVLDASKVERADSASLQMLYAFKQVLESHHLSLNWKSPSERMQESAHLLGLDEHLGMSQMSQLDS